MYFRITITTEGIFKNQVFTLYVIKAQCREWNRLKPVFFGIIHCIFEYLIGRI